MSRVAPPLVAVDVGNSRLKLGLFEPGAPPLAPGLLPEPAQTLDFVPLVDPFDKIADWLGAQTVAEAGWWIGSVQRRVAARLVDWLREHRASHITLLASVDLPLEVSLPRADMVGIDRLLGAVAANRLRQPGAPAIVVDLGTAITVDLVSPAGAFEGGAILPGIGLSARALHEFTDLLPLLDMQTLAEPPPPLGTNTVQAIEAGIYWGAIGGVRQLVELLGRRFPAPPEVFLTGGAAPAVAPLVADQARYEPHLVLAGIALTAGNGTSG